MKLNGQVECSSCKRYYFSSEDLDEDENDGPKTNICCDCEERQRYEPQAKRQRRSGATATAIKQEKLELNDILEKPIVYHDQNQADLKHPVEKENTQNHENDVKSGCMVQIHSIELLSQPQQPFILNTNSKFIAQHVEIW